MAVRTLLRTIRNIRLPETDAFTLAVEEVAHAGALPDAVPVFMAHATGFCRQLFLPVIDALPAGINARFILPDSRLHGDSAAVAAPPPAVPVTSFDWWSNAHDILRIADELKLTNMIGVGHSMGAVSLACAQLLRPGLFRQLLLFEPILVPPAMLIDYNGTHGGALAAAAAKRRGSFPSAAAARAALEGRGAFKGWPAATLDLYVAHAMRVDPVSGEASLKCHPANEASIYRGMPYSHVFEMLPYLSRLPQGVTFARGANSLSHSEPLLEAMAAQARRGGGVAAGCAVIPDAGHLMVFEQPAAVARLVAEAVAAAPSKL